MAVLAVKAGEGHKNKDEQDKANRDMRNPQKESRRLLGLYVMATGSGAVRRCDVSERASFRFHGANSADDSVAISYKKNQIKF